MYGSLWLINYKDKKDSSSIETSDVVRILHEIRLTYLFINSYYRAEQWQLYLNSKSELISLYSS